MKLFTTAAAAALIAMVASAAQAQNMYGQANLGTTFGGTTELTADLGFGSESLENDVSGGFLLSGLVGHNFEGGFSVEGELLFSQSDIDTPELDDFFGEPTHANLTTQGALINGKYTLETGNAMKPYVGAGLGFGKSTYEFLGEEEDDSGLMWQVKVGATYEVSDTMAYDIGYRYVQAPEFEMSDGGASLKAETAFHAVSVGLRFGF